VSTEEFVERARRVHGDRFDYTPTEYRGSSTAVTIICPVHGSFQQTPDNHLAGKGCRRCAGNQRVSVDEAIERFRQIHGAAYEYDRATIRVNKRRIGAISKHHGPFSVSFYRHRKGAGCPQCTGHYQHEAKNHFIRRARAVHGDKYAYGEYIAAAKKMRITCPVHGIFLQSPATHLQRHGCPGCANDGKRLLQKGGYTEEFFVLHPEMKSHPATLYVIEFERDSECFLKVGVTRTGPDSRFKSGYRRYRRRLVTSRQVPLYDAFRLEQRILKRFKRHQTFPKQNRFAGKTECLSVSCKRLLRLWLAVVETYESTLADD
jgi:hypothetical protein